MNISLDDFVSKLSFEIILSYSLAIRIKCVSYFTIPRQVQNSLYILAIKDGQKLTEHPVLATFTCLLYDCMKVP